MTTYSGPTLASTVVRDTQTGTARAAQTWKIHLPVPILFVSYVADVRISGNYTLSIDGVPMATVTCGNASLGNVWAPAVPVELAAGEHTFVLTQGISVQWYNCSNSTQTKSGTGAHVIGWDVWQEPGTSASVAGQINFKFPDGILYSRISPDSASSTSQTGQTWDLTVSQDLLLVGVLKRLNSADVTGYDFKVGGVTKATIVKSHAFDVGWQFVPSGGVLLAAGTHTLKFQGSASRQWTWNSDGSATPTGDGSAYTTAWGDWQEVVSDDKVNATLFFAVPPDPPEDLAVTPDLTTLELSWSPPSGGGTVDHYEVRIDGGSPVVATSPHLFDSLSSATAYDLEVRSVGPGGSSTWALIVGTTDTPVPYTQGWYRAVVTVGSHEWDVERGDATDPDQRGLVLPLTMGWDIDDGVEFFPAQPSITSLSFQVQVASASDLDDVFKGTTVTLDLFIDPASYPDTPWQHFEGIVTQLEGGTVPAVRGGGRDFRASVFAGDDNAALASMVVGYTADWPVESISDRLDRIVAEADITGGVDHVGLFGSGRVGWLKDRDEGAPITALDAIRNTLKDSADEEDSSGPTYYGRNVFQYSRADNTLYLRVMQRRVFPGTTVTLDGSLVTAAVQWSKAPGPSQAVWVFVDGVQFGTPLGTLLAPYVRNTSLYDYTGDPPGSETNWSAIERDSLGESLLPDGSTAVDGWATKVLRYEVSREELEVQLDTTGWANTAPPLVTPVVVTPVDADLDVNGAGYLAGTMTGCRLVIPPHGDYYLEVRLRSELLPGTELPD